jgi:hypothetical protein
MTPLATEPLLPEDRIDLTLYAKVDPARFVQCFRRTWEKIPAEGREILLVHWLRPDSRDVFKITLLAHVGERAGRSMYGYCHHDGLQIGFSIAGIDLLPDHLVDTVIAHELAHAMCFACEINPAEDTIDSMVVKWGFPMAELRQAVALHPNL